MRLGSTGRLHSVPPPHSGFHSTSRTMETTSVTNLVALSVCGITLPPCAGRVENSKRGRFLEDMPQTTATRLEAASGESEKESSADPGDLGDVRWPAGEGGRRRQEADQ